jgi:hypothetical protein
MPLVIPNLDRQQKQNIALAEALQAQQTYINLTAAIKGSYVATLTYNQGDIVLFGGVLYRSLVPVNLGNTPTTSPSQWQTVGTAKLAPPPFVKPGVPG